VVALSREAGAGGEDVARRVASSLHFSCWDHELVETVAEGSLPITGLLDGLDEHPRSEPRYLLEELIGKPGFGEADFVARLRLLTAQLAEYGSAVLVGRGLHALFPSGEAWRVRVIAAEEERSRRLAEERGVSLRQALRFARRVDRERTRWSRRHFGVDPREPSYFDLTVSTSREGVGGAAATIVAGYHRAFPSLSGGVVADQTGRSGA